MKRKNPFSGVSFIGREKELSMMNESIKRGQNVVLHAPLGEGKTALFNRCCSKYNYSKKYEVMCCELMGTHNMSDFIERLINSMKPFTTNTFSNKLLSVLKSFSPSIIISPFGIPELRIDVSPVETETTLEEIKHIIELSSKKYLLYIDEFQEIVNYPDNNVEALLQSFFSSLKNLVCVISGSQNRMVKEILTTKMSSFYLKASIIELSHIDCLEYTNFVIKKFKQINVIVDEKTVKYVYDSLEGSTLHMQSLFSNLYSKIESGKTITIKTINSEINHIISEIVLSYEYLLKRCTPLQVEYLVNLAHDIHLTEKKYTKAQSRFLKEEIITLKNDRCYFNDKFLRVWLIKQFPLSNNKESKNNNSTCRTCSHNPIPDKVRYTLKVKLAYLTSLEWPQSSEKALLVQLKEILESSAFCPRNTRFNSINNYLSNHVEASLESNMVDEIRLYIEDVLTHYNDDEKIV